MARAHLHTCDCCGDSIRCTEPVIHEDSGSHCANYGPYDPCLCDECGHHYLEDDVNAAMHDDSDDNAAQMWAEGR